MSGGVQHYFPASVIGNFSPDMHEGKRRKRRVNVARRGVPKLLNLRAEQAGVMPGHPDIYGDPDSILDKLFFAAEDRIDPFMAGLEILATTDTAPAHWFVMVAAPYVAQLLGRHPQLAAPTRSDMTRRSTRDAALQERYGLIFVLMDRVIHNAVWSLAISSEAAWSTNDAAGCLPLPGAGSGSVLIPISPTIAIFLTSGRPTYRFGSDCVQIRSYRWSCEDQQLINDAIALTAPREVIALQASAATRALDLWNGHTETYADSRGLSAAMLSGFGHSHALTPIIAGTVGTPELSAARFFATTHQFACDCEHQAQKIPPSRRDLWLAERHNMEQRGRNSLRFPPPRPEAGDMVAIHTGRDDGSVLFADRRGLRLIHPDPSRIQGWINPPSATKTQS